MAAWETPTVPTTSRQMPRPLLQQKGPATGRPRLLRSSGARTELGHRWRAACAPQARRSSARAPLGRPSGATRAQLQGDPRALSKPLERRLSYAARPQGRCKRPSAPPGAQEPPRASKEAFLPKPSVGAQWRYRSGRRSHAPHALLHGLSGLRRTGRQAPSLET